MCLDVFAPMVATMEVHAVAMYKAAQGGFINATDLADYLVGRGEPFRTAYKTVGGIVAYAVREHTVLDAIPLDVYKQFDANFEADLYDAIKLETCVAKRTSAGGTSPASFAAERDYVASFLGKQ